MTPPTAGWYDDPNDGSQLRWWDGSVWTKPTRPKQATIAPGWYEDPASPGTTRWWDGAAWSEPPAEAVGVRAGVDGPGDVAVAESGARQTPTPPVALPPEPNLATAPETGLPVDSEPMPAGVMTVGTLAAVVTVRPVETSSAADEATGQVGSALVAGYYDDPENPGSQRWWDGSSWASAAVPEAASVAPAELLADREDDVAVPSRSRRRWLLVVVAILAVALVVGLAWLIRGRLQESHLADPPSTSAEKNWGIAGDSLGSTLAARGITSAQLPTACAGGFQDLWEGPLPTAVQGVDENRARKIYVDACVAGFSHPAGPPSSSAPGPTKTPSASLSSS